MLSSSYSIFQRTFQTFSRYSTYHQLFNSFNVEREIFSYFFFVCLRILRALSVFVFQDKKSDWNKWVSVVSDFRSFFWFLLSVITLIDVDLLIPILNNKHSFKLFSVMWFLSFCFSLVGNIMDWSGNISKLESAIRSMACS